MMLTFTTLSDKNYLDRGIALYESIHGFVNEYKLYYLCLDETTYQKWREIDNPSVIPILIDEEFKNNSDFDVLVANNRSVPIGLDEEYYIKNELFPGYSDFHFALASFFTHHIINKYKPEDILYVDSDILFYHSPQIIFDAGRKNSIGIIRHRHNKVGCIAGGYNVGIVYFKNNEVGNKCLEWWRNVVMDKTNPWFKTHGGCGDQKYLELFISMFQDVKILDEDFGHGAPWNFSLYKYLDDPAFIEWNGKIEKLVFNHFSHFTPTDNGYRVARRKEWSLHIPARKYYDEYWNILHDVKRRYSLCI